MAHRGCGCSRRTTPEPWRSTSPCQIERRVTLRCPSTCYSRAGVRLAGRDDQGAAIASAPTLATRGTLAAGSPSLRGGEVPPGPVSTSRSSGPALRRRNRQTLDRDLHRLIDDGELHGREMVDTLDWRADKAATSTERNERALDLHHIRTCLPSRREVVGAEV